METVLRRDCSGCWASTAVAELCRSCPRPGGRVAVGLRRWRIASVHASRRGVSLRGCWRCRKPTIASRRDTSRPSPRRRAARYHALRAATRRYTSLGSPKSRSTGNPSSRHPSINLCVGFARPEATRHTNCREHPLARAISARVGGRFARYAASGFGDPLSSLRSFTTFASLAEYGWSCCAFSIHHVTCRA